MEINFNILDVPVGELVCRQCKYHMISKEQLAAYLCMTPYGIERLLVGDSAITEKIANDLEEMFDIPAYFWLDMDAIYRERKRQRVEREEV